MRFTDGEKVREIREKLGLSKVEFARLLGISPATLSRIESGEQEVPSRVAAQLEILEKSLQIDPEAARRAYLFGDQEAFTALRAKGFSINPWLLLGFGIVGLLALFALSKEEEKEED